MLKMSSLRVMVKRSRGKKQQKEREKQQHVIVTVNNLFKDFTKEGVRNHDQKQSSKLDNGVAWNSSRLRKFLDGRSAAPYIVTVKFDGLLSTLMKKIGITSECNVKKCLLRELWLKESEEKSNREKHRNNLFKGYTTTDVLNYDPSQ